MAPTLTYYASGTPLTSAHGCRHVQRRGILRRQRRLHGGPKYTANVRDRPSRAVGNPDRRRWHVYRPAVPGHGRCPRCGHHPGGEPGERDTNADLLRQRYTADERAHGRRHVQRRGILHRQRRLQGRTKHPADVHDRPSHADCNRGGRRWHVYRPIVPGDRQRGRRGERCGHDRSIELGERGPSITYYASGTPTAGVPTAAGTYTVVASFAGSVDYKAAQIAPLTFTIGKATPSVTVTDAGGTFSGQAFPAAARVAGVGGTQAASLESVTPTLTYYAGGTPLSGRPRPPARTRSWHPSPAARITRRRKAPPCRSRSARPRRVSP